MLSKAHVEFLKYISNNQSISIQKMCKHFNRTPAFLRSEINTLNQYLEPQDQIQIMNSEIVSTFEYEDFLFFMRNLSIDDYKANVYERQKLLIIMAYFDEFLNLTKIYNDWNLSMTTKKNDIKDLDQKLNDYNLRIERYPGKGVKINGNPLQFRILVVSIISECIDVYTSGIMMRQANTPIERMIYDFFYQKTQDMFDKAQDIVSNFLLEYRTNLNYYSRKFFLLYVILVVFQKKSPIKIIESLALSPHNFYLFEDRRENTAFNQVVSMIDFDPIIAFPYNSELMNLTKKLVNAIEKYEGQNIYTEKEMIEDLYTFIYRQYFFNHFKYRYEDKLVKDIFNVYPELFHFIENSLEDIEKYLLMRFNQEQITSITLIVSKWILKNKIYGEARKKILLVTNIGYERVNYFLESLASYIDFEHVATVDVNELHLLDTFEFDLILSFSNRTHSNLEKLGYDSIKIEYFLDYENVTKLYYAGCSIAKKHLIAENLIKDLEGKSSKSKIDYLRKNYGNIFL